MVYDIPEKLVAPIKKGEVVGSIIYRLDGQQIGTSDIYTDGDVEKIELFDIWARIIKRILCGKI